MSSNCNHATCQGETCRREKKPKKVYQLKRTPLKKRPTPIKKGKPKKKDKSLDEFFETLMRVNVPVCDNCGAMKPILNSEDYKPLWKSCQAHLLQKRHFKSLQTHELNMMVLGSGYSGMCNCHDDFDNNWDKASKMKIWPEVVRRFKILYPLIHLSEYQYIPDVLLKELDI
jgi:hypothetical protein